MMTASYEYVAALAESDPLSLLASIFLFPFLLQAIWYLVVFLASCIYAMFVPQKGDENQDEEEEESIESVDAVPVREETRNVPVRVKKEAQKKSRTPLYPNDPRSSPPSKSILDFPIHVKKERSPTKARTPEQEDRVITSLMKQVGCSRAEAKEVLRRRIAKERALGCY